jgi:hypothetical protein
MLRKISELPISLIRRNKEGDIILTKEVYEFFDNVTIRSISSCLPGSSKAPA